MARQLKRGYNGTWGHRCIINEAVKVASGQYQIRTISFGFRNIKITGFLEKKVSNIVNIFYDFICHILNNYIFSVCIRRK